MHIYIMMARKQISKGTIQSSHPNSFSQLYILNQLHTLVYKTKPSKTKDPDPPAPFWISDLMDFVLYLIKNDVLMFLVNRGFLMNRNTLLILHRITGRLEEPISLLGTVSYEESGTSEGSGLVWCRCRLPG